MGYYAIGAIVLLAGALGIAYVTLDPFDAKDEQEHQAAVVAPKDSETAPAGSAEETAPRPPITGSAMRRMDDFGSGPSGTTVTVPLRNRHRQAYVGSTPGGGESSEGSTAPNVRIIERDIAEDHSHAAGEETETTGADNEDVIPPSFDVVRVDPAGSTVMAGRAAPNTEVEIKAGDKVIDRVTATASGEWVSTPAEPLAAGDQELSLTATSAGGAPTESRQIVVVSVPNVTADDAEPPDQPVAVLLDKDEGGEGRILQAPDKLQSAGDDRLALKVVDYDEEGAIRLSGDAPPGVPVRIYVDNQPAALVIGDSKGSWLTTLDQDLPGGDYTLRLDQLDTKGQTVARLETPLTRVATPPVEGEAKVDYVVVQPGNSLWRIARRLSGDGFNYVYIFEANQAQIRDPDVIYPGQVFEVPTDVGAEIAG